MARLNFRSDTFGPNSVPMPVSRLPRVRASFLQSTSQRERAVILSMSPPRMPGAWISGRGERHRVEDSLVVKCGPDIIQQH